MRAGKLNKKIIIQQENVTTNAYGEEIKTWSTFHECFASVRNYDGLERFEGGQEFARQRTSFGIRYKSGLSVKHRVLFDGLQYQIESINNIDERGREVVIRAFKVEA